MTREINWNVTDVKGKTISFNDVDALKDFALCEAEFWQKQWETIQSFGVTNQPVAFSGYGSWRQIFDLLVSWEENFSQWDQATTDTQMSGQFRTWAKQLNGRWVWSKHDFVDAWVNSYKFSQETGDAFLQAIQGSSPNANSYGSLRGYILAYEFQLQGASDIIGRRASEESAFERTRDELISAKDHLVEEVGGFKRSMEAWSKSIQDNYNSWFEQKQDSYALWSKSQSELSESDSKSRKEAFDQQMAAWDKDVVDLRARLHGELQLRAPCQQWEKRANILRWQGGLWVIALVAVSALALFYGHDFFMVWLQEKKLPLRIDSLQGAIIFASIVSVIIFLTRIFSRLAFSAFHLQRDAEERAQLAYVYLALLDETGVDPESKKIVLQSLFSRAETGLLAGENGPTMPIADLVKATKTV